MRCPICDQLIIMQGSNEDWYWCDICCVEITPCGTAKKGNYKMDKKHYKAVSPNPYIASTDLTDPIVVTIKKMAQEVSKLPDKRTHNVAYFEEAEIHPGHKLKPMIVNTGVNSKAMLEITGSPFIEDWVGHRVELFVDPSAKYAGEVVGGLRIRKPRELPTLTPKQTKLWQGAVNAYKRDGNLSKVRKHYAISPEAEKQIKEEANAVAPS